MRLSNDEVIRRAPILLIALFVSLVGCGGGGGGGGSIHFTLYSDIGVWDLNGDSRPDLAITSFDEDGNGKVYVLLQSATDDGVFDSAVDYRVGDWPSR